MWRSPFYLPWNALRDLCLLSWRWGLLLGSEMREEGPPAELRAHGGFFADLVAASH
jgi:hypothetical protein